MMNADDVLSVNSSYLRDGVLAVGRRLDICKAVLAVSGHVITVWLQVSEIELVRL